MNVEVEFGSSECSCKEHYKIIEEECFHDTVDHAFEVLFTNSEIYVKTHTARETQGLEVGEWKNGIREITFNALAKMPLSKLFKESLN